MYLRTLLIVFLVAVVAIFAILNWSAFMSETTLSVGFTSVQAPLGLVLLIVTALLALLFLIDHLRSRGSTWLDAQVMTDHMKALGAKDIDRNRFLDLLSKTQASQLFLFS